LLRYQIKLDVHNGDMEAAMRAARDFLRFTQLVRQRPPDLGTLEITFESGMNGGGLWAFQQIARNPKSSRQDVLLMLELANNMPPCHAAYENAAKAEFAEKMLMLDTLIVKNTPEEVQKLLGSKFPGYFITRRTYLPKQTRLDMADHFRSFMEEIQKFYSEINNIPPWYEKTEPTFSNVFNKKNYVGRLVARVCAPGLWFYASRCHDDAQLAATKIILACQLFQRETGRKPQTLGELAPDYLPVVPLDPFDAQPFRYNFDEGTVYSVGEDLKDCGGVVASGTGVPRRNKNIVFKIWDDSLNNSTP
jgi:hypothetical protein